MRDLGDAALATTAENAWTTFLASRFDNALSGCDGPSQRATRTRIADIELAAMHKTLALANQRRNATTAAAGLPAELLVMIFSAATDIWAPFFIKGRTERYKAEKKKEKPLCYDLGWIFVSHVCSSWRKIAICSPDLWSKLECLNLPPRFTFDILLRSQQLPLDLSILEYTLRDPLDSEKAASIISGWLCGPTLRRTQKLVLQILNPTADDLHIIGNTVPILEEVHLSFGEECWIPYDMLALHTAGTLKTLGLRHCFPRWENLSISCTLTSLHLEGQVDNQGEIDRDFYPSIPGFQKVLASLPRLENLSLTDFFPVRAHDPEHLEVVHLHSTFKRFELECNSNGLLDAFQDDLWAYFKFPPTSVVVSRVLDDLFEELFDQGDGGIFQPLFELDYQSIPALELYASPWDISIRHTVETERQNWTWCRGRSGERNPVGSDPHFFYDTVCGSRHIYFSAIIDWLHFLDDRFPLNTIRAICLGEMGSMLPSSASWLGAFVAQCPSVERLAFSFPGSSSLLSAMSLPNEGDTHGGEHGTFKLFPSLKFLVIHAGSAHTPESEDTDGHHVARDISLVYLVDARREAGWPIEELLVDRALENWEVWGKLGEAVKVSYFD